jgi:PAS domain S-box-containing protein
MSTDQDKSRKTTELRRQAEERLNTQAPEALPLRTEDETRRLLHELQVHQIELEMQNEELRRAQEDFELSRNKYLELYDFAPVGYFTFAAAGVIREVNLTGAQLLGMERQTLAGKPFSRFIAAADDRAIFSSHLEEVLQREGSQRCEIRLTGKNGAVVYAQLQSIAVDTGESQDGYILSSIADVTVAKLSEAALAKGGALQGAIFNSANFSSIATDAKGVIQIFNVGAERMLGYTAAEVMNKITPADISDPQELIARAKTLSAELETPITPGFEALVFKASRTIEDIYELTYIRKDGSRFPAVVSVTALRDAQDAIIGYLLIGTDNTARKQAEAALLKAGALQSAIFNSANFSSIATDAKGVIQIFNVGAERMLGYTAAEVMNQITPADISDPQEVIARAKALSAELGTPITPGFEALVFKASRGIEDIYELTYIRKDGSRFPAVVSVTALRDAQNDIIGYLLIGTDNTARKQAEAALLKAGALQSAIFNSAVFASVATDAKGVIQIFNVGAERMLGYTAAEVMNQITPADISDPQELIVRAKALSLELETPITPGFEALVFKASRGIEDIYELTYIRKDGSRFPAVVSVTALRDAHNAIIGYLLIGTDNTARKQIEAEKQHLLDIQEETHKQLQQTNFTLQVSEERLAVTLNSIGDAVIATDAGGLVTLLNPLAEQLTGWTREEAFGRPVDEIFQIINKETRQPAVIPVVETLAHGTIQGLANHTVLIARGGSECDIADSCAPIRDRDAQVIGAVLVFRDVTGEYAVQKALRESTQALQDKNVELENATRVAEKANRAKSEFLSSMSHELRSPLNAILGFAQLLDKGSPSPKEKSSIDQILKAGWYLLKLINEILDLALIESGKMSLSLEPMSLVDVMLECQTMIEPEAQKSNIHLIFPKFESPYFVHADRTRVKQVLINLLSNAIKYNRPNGEVEVTCRVSGPGRIRISVQDTGEGLSPEKIADLFQPFNRLGQEAGPKEGTGIGLVVSKRLIELMDGEIGVESTVGVGTVLWIELILAVRPQITTADAEVLAAMQVPVQQDSTLRTLLYVEDNQANMQLVERLIELRSDLRLIGAIDGTQGIALANIHRPAVILMDINLPGISGIQALKILREDPTTAQIPVIAISANAMPRDIEKGLEAGFFRYLTKPIKVNEFMDTLDEALKYTETAAVLTAEKESI